MVPIPDHPNYLIDELGNIWSIVRHRFLKQDMNNCGYRRVSLCCEGVVTRLFVHRLMASAFLGLPLTNKELVVNHKNGNKGSNELVNLEVITKSQNQHHAIRLGLQSTLENSPSAKITNETCHQICELLEEGLMPSVIAKQLSGVTANIVTDIKRGRTWRPISEQYALGKV